MGFQKLFWGIFFLFTFRLNGYDMLPDTIGYLLILLGLIDLRRYGSHFEAGRMLAIIALILSIFTFYQPPANSVAMIPGVLSFLLNAGLLVVNAALFFQICCGIRDLASSRGNGALAQTAMQRWKWFFRIIIANLVVWVIGLLLPGIVPLLPVLILILFAATVIIYAFMMGLMSQAGRNLQ